MIARVARRFAWSVFVVAATVTIAFFVNNALPTNPARMVAGPQARPSDVERIRSELGLDRPLYVQYGRFITRLVHIGPADGGATTHASCTTFMGRLHVDLGRSYQQRRPVATILAERLPRSILLGVAAALVQALLGVVAGVVAAARKGTALDVLAVSASLLGVSAPTFVIGLLLQWIFAHELRVLPLDGYGETLGEHLQSLVLPAVTLGIFGAAYYTRMVRDEMLVQMRQDYMRTARAKGLSQGGALARHALRNALMPIVTVLGLELGTLASGAIVTETLFRWPGLGALSVTALLDRDGPVVMGCVIVTSSLIVASTIAVDLAYAVLDPRVRRR